MLIGGLIAIMRKVMNGLIDYEEYDCRCICHFTKGVFTCRCCEWSNEKWLKELAD